MKSLLNIFFVSMLLGLPAYSADDYTDDFPMTAKLKEKIYEEIKLNIGYKKFDGALKKEVKHYLSTAIFSFKKSGDNFQFKLLGKLNETQDAVDRCEGTLSPDDVGAEAWSVEFDSCNF